MTRQETLVQSALIRPAARRPKERVGKRRPVAGPLKAVVGPQNLQRALAQAAAPRRRRESAERSGYDAQAQKLTFEPYLRALLVRPIVGGSVQDLPHGMAHDPLYAGHGAQVEISVPAWSKATATRPAPAFWDVLAEVMAAVDALPQT